MSPINNSNITSTNQAKNAKPIASSSLSPSSEADSQRRAEHDEQSKQSKRARMIGNGRYELAQIIGRGAHGTVYKGFMINEDTEEIRKGEEERALAKTAVAVKEISLQGVVEKDLATVTGEVDLLSSLNHANVVRYIEAIREDENLYIVLEYCENGSLSNALKQTAIGLGQFPESLAAAYVFHVLEGLTYLHEQGVIHRDVKGANILCTKDGVVKLADFGVATKVTTANSQAASARTANDAKIEERENTVTYENESSASTEKSKREEEEEMNKLVKNRRSQMALKNRLSKENSGSLEDKPSSPAAKGEQTNLGGFGFGRIRSLKNDIKSSPKKSQSPTTTEEFETPVGKLSSMSSPTQNSPSSPPVFSENVGGSPYWMAPEVIEMTGGVTTAADIWSVGCTLIEMLTTKPPYFDLAPMAALFRMVRDDIPPLPSTGISKQCEDFLRQCFRRDPATRPTARELLNHPWIKDVRDELASTWLPKHIRDTQNKLMDFSIEENNERSKSVDQDESVVLRKIADGLAAAVDNMVAGVEYRDSVYFSSEQRGDSVMIDKNIEELKRMKRERRELKKKLRKVGDEKPDLKKMSTIDRATAALMAADAVLDNKRRDETFSSDDSDSDSDDGDTNNNGPGYKRNNMRIDVKNLPASNFASGDSGKLLKEWLDMRSGRKRPEGTRANMQRSDSDTDSTAPPSPSGGAALISPKSQNMYDIREQRNSLDSEEDEITNLAKRGLNGNLMTKRGFSRSSSFDDLYGSYGTSQFDETHINDAWETLALAMDAKDNGAVERAGISVKDSMERYHLSLDTSDHGEDAIMKNERNGLSTNPSSDKLDASESYGTCKAIPSRRVLASAADILSSESPEYDRSRCVALEALCFAMRAADQTSRISLASALVSLEVCRFASIVTAKDFEFTSRRAKIAALNLLESVAKCQVPSFSAIAPSVAPGIAKALSVGYFGESGKALTRVAVDAARAIYIPPKPRERLQAAKMRAAMVSLKRKLQGKSRFDDKELRNIEREIHESDVEILKAEAAQLDATWANVRALAKADVFPHLVQALGQTHFGHLEEATIANEHPSTFTSLSTLTNEKIADFIANLLSNNAMTSSMLSEGKGDDLNGTEKKKKNNENGMQNNNGDDGDDDDVEEDNLVLLEQNAMKTGFKSFDSQTKNLLCDIGVIHGFLAQICVVSKNTREKLAKTIESLTENADTLDKLQKSGCIPKLAQLIEITWREDNDDDNQIGYLGFDAERGSKRVGVINVDLLYESVACNGRTRTAALRAIRNLCVASKSYQQQAATCHASWVLCEIATNGTEIEKNICIPLLSSCVSASRAAREKLEKHGILDTFVSVIAKDENAEHKILAIQACSVWLNAEPWEMEARLLTADALDVLSTAFEFSVKNKHNINGESTLNNLAKLVGESARLSRAIAEKGVVPKVLSVLDETSRLDAITSTKSTAGAKLAALKCLGHLVEHSDDPKEIIREHKLREKLTNISMSKNEVIVAQLTEKLMRRLNF